MRARDATRRIANLMLAVSQPVTSALTFPDGGRGSELLNSTGDPPIVPAAYAFSIWGLIFVGSIAYGVYQCLPSKRTDPRLRSIGPWTAMAFLATSLWLVFARYNLVWMTFACIVWIFVSLTPPFIRTHEGPRESSRRWLVRIPVAIFIGWITIAMFANFAAALKASGVAIAMTQWFTIVLLLAASATAAALIGLSRGDLAYAGTILWALIAIAVDNAAGKRIAVVSVCVILAIVVAGFALRFRKRSDTGIPAWR